MTPFTKFLLVGTLGFAVDAGILVALSALCVSASTARPCSFLVAVTVTWYLNRTYTFHHLATKHRLATEWLRYLITGSSGAAVNLLVFYALLWSAPGAIHPLIALASGSIAALLFNFLGAKHFAFRCGRPQGK